MAKIWYSVQGDGLGHAIRSSSIIEALNGKHKLLVTGCNKSYPFLRKKFGKIVHKIEGHSFVYENNGVNIPKSLFDFMRTWPEKTSENYLRLFALTRKFSPDLIISDFEPLSHYFSFFLGVPIISLDNINILSECEKIKVEAKYQPLYLATREAIKLFHPRSDYYLITSIINLKPNTDKVFLFPPVLRKEVLAKKSKPGDYILIYQSTATNSAILPVLKSLPINFVIYGMGETGKDKNLTFRQFSEQGFIDDLRSSRAVIVNGGFTVISEAVYYKKPVFVIPIKNQFEQIFNGMTLKQLGYGDWSESFVKGKIASFISSIPEYEKNLTKSPTWDNSAILAKLEKLIAELAGKPKPLLDLSRKLQKLVVKTKHEQTLVIIKPDAVEKGLIGEIICRLEKTGIKPVAIKMRKLNKLEVRFFYSHLKGKVPDKVFKSIITFMTSNKVVLMVWQGNGATKKVRELCGPTDPQKAKLIEIRSLSDENMQKQFNRGKAVKNIIHSSANINEAKKEVSFFFKPWQI